MSDTIFLRQGDTLTPLHRADFDSEDALQTILARYPDLLAGEQMRPESPRRWLLITREMGVPDAPDAPDRWSLDHLFVDQDAIPTLVEVKRASDTRIRREVVGQMLDYASNAVTYWPISAIRSSFEQTVRSRGLDPLLTVWDLMNGTSSASEAEPAAASSDPSPPNATQEAVDGFWSRMETNLQAGRIRMVFVADRVPEELRRIVEFLNRQLALAEVLAVELPQFVGSNVQTLVPRVIGLTAEARSRKRAGGGTPSVERWTEEEFFSELKAEADPAVTKVARDLLEWSKANALNGRIDWTAFGFVPVFKGGRAGFGAFLVEPKDSIRIYLQVLRFYPPFDAESKRRELIDRLNQTLGVAIPQTATNGKPSIPQTKLTPAVNFNKFIEVVNWIRREVEQATPSP